VRTIRNLSFLLLVAVCWLSAGRTGHAWVECDWLGDHLMLYGDTGPGGHISPESLADDMCEEVKTDPGVCADYCRETEGCGYDGNNLTGECDVYASGSSWDIALSCTCELGVSQ
jgi:hypothetical protein